MSGENVEDSELDCPMEDIAEKWEEAETAKDFQLTNKKADAGEEIRGKACEHLGETVKRKGEMGETEAKKSNATTQNKHKSKFLISL